MSRVFQSPCSQKLRVPILPSVHTRRNARCNAVADANDTVACLKTFLSEQGAGEQQIDLKPTEIDGHDTVIDISVAKTDLKAGDIALRIPDNLVVTLEGVFEDGGVAELLTTDALSELSCLALYLMYEKKRGKESFWHAYISELDRQRARGPQAAESPLIWSDEEVTEYLRGSPVQKLVQERITSIREEYECLDTVWFMSKSLFNKYPYDVPTEAFSFEIFRQAFAAVQASVVHLQGVELARRFALVPLGPPSLSYSSTCKAMLTHNDEAGEVQLRVDREYKAGERVYAWCGPQPNSRLMVNYGIVDEGNPYDKLSIVATMINTGPLFQLKRKLLEGAELSTKHTFQLQRGKGLPAQLIPYMKLCYCTEESKLADIDLQQAGELSDADAPVLKQLRAYLQQRLARYDRTIEEDKILVKDPSTPVRQQVACRMLVCEKEILHEALDALMELPNVPLESDMSTPIVVDNEFLRLE